jgi:hypothetical protein
MGYTHYVNRPVKNAGSAYMFGKLALDAKKICDWANENGIRVRNYAGEGEPEFNESYFAFNGDGHGENDYSHETFHWDGIPTQVEWRKEEKDYFDFCKTARKPYDAVVTAVLIRAKHIYGSCVSVSSDGDWEDWSAGRTVYELVFGETAECPFDKAITNNEGEQQ